MPSGLPTLALLKSICNLKRIWPTRQRLDLRMSLIVSVTHLLQQFGYCSREMALGPVILDLHRDPKTGAFKDADIIRWIVHGITNVAGSFGANKVPEELRFVEVVRQKRDCKVVAMPVKLIYSVTVPRLRLASGKPASWACAL
jgi:hypothetical protein